MLRCGQVLGVLLAGILALSPAARAEDAVATSESSSGNSVWNAIQKNGKASYLLWLYGMHTEALSGNRAGGGTDLTADHYIAIGAALGKGFSLKLTNLGRQSINEAPEAAGKTFVWQDPYLTLSRPGILKDEARGLNLDTYVRYYIPTSAPTINGVNKGAVDDHGRGTVRLYVSPSKAFFDGKLTLSGTMLTNIKLNSLTPQERVDRANRELAKTGKGNLGTSVVSYRNDMYFLADPVLAYTASNKLEIYLEWYALWNHTTNGQWTSIDEPESDQTLSPGLNWTPTKKILVNPYLEYKLSTEKKERKLGVASVGVQMQYSFL
jgi:hypothetical protein